MITWSQHQDSWEQAVRLEALREQFPDWGFLVIGRRWVALRGRNITLTAATAEELGAYLRTELQRPDG